MAFSWIAVDALTGVPWAELLDFNIDTASILISKGQTATGTYPLTSSATPPDWLQGSVPWGVAILLLSDDAPDPLGGWYINQRTRTAGNKMSIPMITGEGYFARRYVGNATFTNVDQNTICASLVTSFAVAPPSGSTGLAGLPFIINVVGAAGATLTRPYVDINDVTVGTALTEIMGLQGGAEWCVTWKHFTNPERYFPVFNVGTRIGSPVTAGLAPSAVFEMGGTTPGGSVTEVTFTEDYTAGKGANFVTATGTTDGSGNRPQQSVSAADTRRPAIEFRWNPSSQVSSTADLLSHAMQAVPLMQNGAKALTLASDATTGPRLGSDWFLGDSVGYAIGGLDQNGKETVPAFPGGISGTARVLGWTMQLDIPTPVITPILGGV